MCPAAILGDRASGKTTFLGALYATQVRYGSGTDDDFRFYAPPDSLNFMTSIYEAMMAGNFPSATLKDEMTQVNFLLGYKTLLGKMGLGKIEARAATKFAWRSLRFGAYDVSGEDVQEYIESGVASSPIIQQLLHSAVVVILVDCSKMTLDNDSPAFKQMIHYDSQVAKLISNFATYKSQEFSRVQLQRKDASPPLIYPAIVLTKVDMLRDEVLQKLGLTGGIPAAGKTKERQDYAEALLRVFLRQTLAQVRGSKIAGVSFDRAAYFVSWIHTVTADGGMALPGKARIAIRPASASGSAEMDYSYEEYVAFIDHFRDIANKVPDAEVANPSDLAPRTGP